MTFTQTSFIDNVFQWPVVAEGGFLSRHWVQWFLRFVKRVQLVLCDTSTGAGTFTLGLAAKNQNVEVVVFKTSADANVVTVAPLPGDTIYGAATTAAQNGRLRFIADGVTGWYSV